MNENIKKKEYDFYHWLQYDKNMSLEELNYVRSFIELMQALEAQVAILKIKEEILGTEEANK